MTFVSLGTGVQSSALYILDEPAHVYAQLERLKAWGRKHGGARIDTVTIGKLSDSLTER